MYFFKKFEGKFFLGVVIICTWDPFELEIDGSDSILNVLQNNLKKIETKIIICQTRC